jgi:hypothetical protein
VVADGILWHDACERHEQTQAEGVNMAIRKFPAILFGLVVLPSSVLAAPFCIENQAMSPYCIYYDADSCQREANRQGATCSVNTNEVALVPNVGQYCLVTSQGASLCIYSDRGTCAIDAERQHASCTNAPIVAPSAAPDPYAAIGGR